MILHPPVLALTLAALICAALFVWASAFAVRLLRSWNLASGAQTQIDLEKRTYFVAVIMRFVAVAQLGALVLFVFNADRMAPMFVGAMCAVGTLNASLYGFPALWTKIALFFGASLWLVLDVIDGRGRDYPLTPLKYSLLLAIAPLVFADAALTLAYFLDLHPDTLTSCCGKLFTPDRPTITAQMAAISPRAALIALGSAFAVVVACAAAANRSRTGGALYAAASMAFLGVALTAVVSAISLYVYENPNHHCPFCLLKREYGYFGFALYIPLFFGAAAGLAGGVLRALPTPPSLADAAPAMRARLTMGSIAGFALFMALAAIAIRRSALVLIG